MKARLAKYLYKSNSSYTTTVISCYTYIVYVSTQSVIMVCTRPVSHTGHHLGPFHDCSSHRQHCHGDWSQLCQEELLDFHASEMWLEIELHLSHDWVWGILQSSGTVEGKGILFFESATVVPTHTHTHNCNWLCKRIHFHIATVEAKVSLAAQFCHTYTTHTWWTCPHTCYKYSTEEDK